jgi:DNA-binding transcriptional ArsR family regulator
MDMEELELLCHPIRSRIIQSFQGGRQLTPLQLLDYLSDIPQATLYRHLKKLVEANVLFAAEKRQIRGATEILYGLDEQKINITLQDVSKLSKEEHMYFFKMYLSLLQNTFQQYLRQESFDFEADQISYGQEPIYISNEEYANLFQEIQKLIKSYSRKSSSPEHQRRMISIISIPDPK